MKRLAKKKSDQENHVDQIVEQRDLPVDRTGRVDVSIEYTNDEQSGKEPCAVVGIGASAGGLDAFTRLLKQLPSDTGMAFVLVQHLDPKHKSALTEILSKATSTPVEHPVTHTLIGSSGNLFFMMDGNTRLFKVSNASGSRKKLVTLISRS